MDVLQVDNELTRKGRRSVAIISGKGGSGKTVLTTTMAKVFNELNTHVVIIDADTATAGMTYFLGVHEAEGREGLTSLLSDNVSYVQVARPLRSLPFIRFIGIGNHRSLYDGHHLESTRLLEVLKSTINQALNDNWVLVDCRGGLDEHSLEVCTFVDDIVIVAEVDTTSFQATAHLIDVLDERGMKAKIRGFVINKVIYDPTIAIKSYKSFFGVPYLFSFPLDLKVTASFVRGEIPGLEAQFSIHVWEVLHRLYNYEVGSPKKRVWKNWEFRETGLVDRESRMGGVLTTLSLVVAAIVLFRQSQSLRTYFSDFDPDYKVLGLMSTGLIAAGLGILGSLQETRRLIGRVATTALRLLRGSQGHDGDD